MKQQPHQNIGAHGGASRSPQKTHSPREDGMNANRRLTPPTVLHRRYPSLSDDGQPWFPRAPWSRQSENEPAPANTSLKDGRSEFPFVRAIALIAIVVIVAVLAANS